MAKNPRRTASSPLQAPIKTPLLSRRGRWTLLLGIGVAIAGYGVLTYSDPAGQNWASHLAVVLLILGYALMGVGIVLRDPASTPSGVGPTASIS